MKDLYSFDANEENALKTYQAVTEAYEGIFQELGVKYVRGLFRCTSYFLVCFTPEATKGSKYCMFIFLQWKVTRV